MNRLALPVVLVATLCVLTSESAAASGPKIQFEKETFDFGRINQGEVAHAAFVFTNVGDAPLEITAVRPSCGCTTAGAWDKLVAPGKTGQIPLQVNTAHFSGPVYKSATVTCNDTSRPTIHLQITGTIWQPIVMQPSFVVFNVTPDTVSNQVQTVRITNNTPDPLTISDLKSSNPAFKPVLQELQAGKAFALQVHLVPPIASHTVQGAITARTSSTKLPSLSLTAMAVVQPPVRIYPSRLTLQPGPLPTTTAMALRIYNNQTATPLELTNASVNLSNVTVNIRPEQLGRLYTVTLGFPAGLDLPPGRPAEFTVKTSNPHIPIIRVPIVQIVRPTPPPMARPRPSVAVHPPAPPAHKVELPGAPSPDR